MRATVVTPRLELRPYVRNIFVGGFPGSEVVLPATADVQLVVYLQGGGALSSLGAAPQRLPEAFLAGASFAPSRLCVDAGARFMAVNFRPSGLLACCGLSAAEFAGRLVPLHDVFAAGAVEQWLCQLRAAAGVAALVKSAESFLLGKRHEPRSQHLLLPRLGLDRLLLPARALARELDVGPRQLERRFLANFGVSLRDYRRFARFSVAFASLATANYRRGTLAAGAYDAGYVDQAHFSRDFKAIVGTSPMSFIHGSDDDDSPYAIWRLPPDQLRSYLP